MKALSLTIQKIWPRLKFLKSGSKVKVKGQKVKNFVSSGKVLSEGIYMCNMNNMKGLALTVQKLWPRLKFLKSRSKIEVKVTRPKVLVPLERPSHKVYTCEI